MTYAFSGYYDPIHGHVTPAARAMYPGAMAGETHVNLACTVKTEGDSNHGVRSDYVTLENPLAQTKPISPVQDSDSYHGDPKRRRLSGNKSHENSPEQMVPHSGLAHTEANVSIYSNHGNPYGQVVDATSMYQAYYGAQTPYYGQPAEGLHTGITYT